MHAYGKHRAMDSMLIIVKESLMHETNETAVGLNAYGCNDTQYL